MNRRSLITAICAAPLAPLMPAKVPFFKWSGVTIGRAHWRTSWHASQITVNKGWHDMAVIFERADNAFDVSFRHLGKLTSTVATSLDRAKQLAEEMRLALLP